MDCSWIPQLKHQLQQPVWRHCIVRLYIGDHKRSTQANLDYIHIASNLVNARFVHDYHQWLNGIYCQ